MIQQNGDADRGARLIQAQQAYRKQVKSIVVAGAIVALVLAMVFMLMLQVDKNTRLAAAQRQAVIQADATQRVVSAQLDSYKQVMSVLGQQVVRMGLLASANRLMEHQKTATVAEAERLAPGLVELSIVNEAGNLLFGERGDPDFYDWAVEAERRGAPELIIGPLQTRSDGKWRLPIAKRIDANSWVLGRMESRTLQQLVNSSSLGAGGLQLLIDSQKLVLADSRGSQSLGRLLPGDWPLEHGQIHTDSSVFSDEIIRIGVMAQVEGMPLWVVVGRARDEALTGWWRYFAGTVLVFGIYLAGMGYLLRAVRQHYLSQNRLGEELQAGSVELALANQIGRVSNWKSDGVTLHWGQGGSKQYAVDKTSMPVEELFERVHREDAVMVRKCWEMAKSGQAPLDVMFRVVLTGGSIRWLSVRGELLSNGSGYMAGATVDVTERCEAQERAREAERQFRLLFDRNPVPIWLFDLETLSFLEVNEAATRQYGYRRDEFLTMSILDIRPEDEQAEVRQTVDLALKGVVREPRVRTHLRKDGSRVSVMAQTALLEFAGHQACLVLAVDVTERLAYERDLAYRASHHSETGLMTPRALAETLDMRQRPFAIAHIQLRGLQMVSHTLGHEIGEHVLRAVATRLGGLGGRYGLLAYQPGEDFILAIKGRYDLEHVIEHLCEVLSEPVRGPESYHQLQAHIGVDVCEDGRGSAAEYLAHAAQAAWSAREVGALVRHYDNQIASRLTSRLHLAARIHTAIEQGEFELYFQPICDASSGQPVMLEALLRWPQSDGSWIAPSEFIGLAEDTGQMIALGRWVIRAAARAQSLLSTSGWSNLGIAVNVSAVQFFNDDLVGEFVRACEDAGVKPSMLQVELTESSLMRDPERGLATMKRLHEQGISIALDDFGTGFSSMSYLQHLPLDVMKIDRSFLGDVETDSRNAAICRALLSLGHSLGLQVVAEGVETEAQRRWMQDHGCDHLQGYLLGRPAPMQATLQWLDELGVTA